jgi:hypothetical protein
LPEIQQFVKLPPDALPQNVPHAQCGFYAFAAIASTGKRKLCHRSPYARSIKATFSSFCHTRRVDNDALFAAGTLFASLFDPFRARMERKIWLPS